MSRASRGRYHLPVFIFGLYTVLVWWAAFRYRRTIQGVVAVLLGVGGLFLLAEILTLSFSPSGGGRSPLVTVLLFPYGGLLLAGGMYILALPAAKRVMTCRTCSYDMRGLDDGARCPECGREDAAVRPPRGTLLAAPESPEDAQSKDPDGKPGEQGPTDPRVTAA